MSLLRRARGSGRPGLLTTLLVAMLLTATVSAAPSASAQTPRGPAAQARVLLARVHVLQAQTAAALKRYQGAYAQMALGVSTSINAGRTQRAAQDTVSQSQEQLDQRVRSLYTSGGRAGLYSSLFSGEGLEGFTNRVMVMQRLVSDSTQSAVDAGNAAQAADKAVASAQVVADTHVQTAGEIGDELARLQALLDEQGQLLAAANAGVRNLAAVKAAADALAAARAAAAGAGAGGLNLSPMPGSPEYFRLYHAAAPTCPGLSWTVLAAVGQVESGHGRNIGPSSSGAMGPMQFMPGTFARYAVDGDHDGRLDIMSPADAIFSAAHYLCANGAGTGPAGLDNALFHYNHAQWYVDMVLALAARYAAGT